MTDTSDTPSVAVPRVRSTAVLEHRDRPRDYRVPGGRGASTVDMLYHIAHALYTLALGVNRNASYYVSLGRNIREPRLGDLVCEMSSFRAPADECVGWLKAVEPQPYGDIYVIERYVDGEEMRWENCSFVAIPISHIDIDAATWRIKKAQR